ncbi:MFS transporter [Thalassospira sp.]|uniref:MFS transporter n=1 Tax=Thalassospira sp. TaxID=1912094 RepID=UPI002735DDF1|nr:MFS transporter [Thalassospira sp.]MDP2696715.1 MFS transporter [Thalassospira sp.]
MPHQEKKLMFAVFLTVLFGFAGFSLPYPVFSPMFLKPELGFLDPSVPEQHRTILLGIAMALYPIGQFIGAPFLGRWSDRIGRRPVLLTSLFGAGASYVITAIGVASGSLTLVLVGRFVSGLCEGNMAIAQSVASDISTTESKVRNFGLITVAINVGWIIGPLLGGFLSDPAIHPSFNVALPFFFAAGMFAINLLVVYVTLRIPGYARRRGKGAETEVAPAVPARRSVWATLIDRDLLPAFSVTFFSYIAVYIFFVFFGVYLVQTQNVSSSYLGMAAAIISIPLIAAGLLVDRSQKRFGLVGVGALGHLFLAIGLITFLLPDDLIWIFVPMSLAAFGIAWCEVTTSLFISNAAGAHEQGQALGVYRSVHVLAEAIAVLIGGVLAGIAATAPFFLGFVCAMICVAGILTWVRLRLRASSAVAPDI